MGSGSADGKIVTPMRLKLNIQNKYSKEGTACLLSLGWSPPLHSQLIQPYWHLPVLSVSFSSLCGAHGGSKEGGIEPIPTTEKSVVFFAYSSFKIYLQNECSLFNIKYFF